jgi:iron complex outermembrane receptor protein
MGKRTRLASGLIAALLVTGSALAEDDPEGALEDVVVTAQRREENTQRAPVAITALAPEQLAGATEASDLSKLVPAAQIGPSQGPQPLCPSACRMRIG